MITMFVRHEVRDHSSWKRVYDGFATVRKELKSAMAKAGVTGQPEIWFSNEIEQTSF